MKKKIVLIILTLFQLLLFSKTDIKFSHLTVADGLTQNIITDISQDKDGYMWFGTRNGLNKFDGFNITQYLHDDNDSTSLAANTELLVWNDNEGDMWVYTTDCFHKYIKETDNFKRYYYSSEEIIFLDIKEYYKIKSSNIGSPNNTSLPIYIKEKDKFEKISVKHDDLKAKLVFSYIDNDKVLWLFFDAGDYNNSIIKYDPDNTQEKFVCDNFSQPLTVTDNNLGSLLIGTWKKGLKKINKKTGEITSINYSNSSETIDFEDSIIFEIIVEKNGSYWLVVSGIGLVYFDIETEKFSLYSHEDGIKESLAHNAVGNLFKDKFGNMWVGSTAKGISYFNPNKSDIQHIRKSFSAKTTLSNNSIYALLEDYKGNIWIGTDGGGLNIYDPQKDSFITYNTKNKINSNTVISFIEDNNKNIWIGPWFQTLQKYDSTTKKIITYDGNDSPLCDEIVVRDLFLDSAQRIWIAGEIKGVTLFDAESNRFETILINNELISTTIGIVYTIIEDSEHNMIFGGSKGILKYYPETGKSEQVFKKNQAYFVWSLFTDKQSDNIWIGTNGNGLKRLDSKTLTLNTPKFLDELSQNVIYGILKDNQERLWISSSNGIFRINLDTEEITRFDVSEGLQDNDFNQGAFAMLSSGKMMFGGHNGFNIIDPETFKVTESKAEILITKFLVDGKIEFPKNEQIKIPYEKNNIQIEFTNLNFINTKKTMFKYKLENFDDDWFESDYQRRYARYTNLPVGEYTFIVNVSNSSQLQDSCSKRIAIVILKPFWQKWWFLTLISIALVIMIYSLLKVKTKFILLKNKNLEKLIQAKTSEIKSKNQKLEAIFNNAIAGIVISDFNLDITYANEYFKKIAHLDNYNSSTKNLIQFIHPEDYDEFQSEIEKLIEQKNKNFYSQIRIRNCKNEILWIGISCSIISENNKNSLIMVLIDINEQKITQEKVLKLEKRNSVMAMAVTANHELNQPLMVISGNIEMLIMTSNEDFLKTQQKRINRINESIQKMTQILTKYKETKGFWLDAYTESTEMVKFEDE